MKKVESLVELVNLKYAQVVSDKNYYQKYEYKETLPNLLDFIYKNPRKLIFLLVTGCKLVF